jgi:hypothetical protein
MDAGVPRVVVGVTTTDENGGSQDTTWERGVALTLTQCQRGAAAAQPPSAAGEAPFRR